ncbi:putative Enoyl-CoA hydratase/isomerase [Candidatus Terasakiella magnetica]|uniref:Putative Enoyl-CoA hydratase/isomerase n=1 Tax=Candidatus Terasakiella magnetica TaxID=1867952 RepID=A0A1C3RCV3_9PROT|nr:enoyl-CoA hydratase-related protein [Candidatus Terasakiella magnetica]SCA55109.1 putative Enoyl-CoA hydratase/isomerase [Candidatus Terasakiella magnetica]
MSEPILLQRDGTIATVTINNPEKRNALTKPAWQKLGDVMEELSADNDLRCIILRGAGDEAFAAGADIGEFPEERSSAAQAKAYGEIVTRTVKAIEECRHPTLAMIKGACTGGGLEIACACDMRIAGESSRFGVPINRLGHTLAYPELDAILRLVSPAVMLELLLEGRVVDADYALRVGMINRIVEDWEVEEEAKLCAERIAKGAPLAARLHKKMVSRLKQPSPLTQEELDEAFSTCDSEDYQNGYRAFMEKKKPIFKAK